jgi:xylose isomerase
MRAARYATYDTGDGKLFEEGQLTLEGLAALSAQGEPPLVSGKQELYENIINQYIK